ncbi:MAG: acyl-[acyl-carrier-protein]--UDP-N-acetylglucosamine O-acyltransferase [Verrucomicrobia bacterium]|nr:MAG: acyl-[acyl-carrier-protein]--UDP-N-acetylglucosamine O-acyltransferase [Verrucomicrobiota bacterium]
MESRIHPTAIVSGGADIGPGVEIGPFAYIGPEVVAGEGTIVHHHACVEGATVLGPGCEIFPFACLGLRTQDLKYKGGRPRLRVGARNVFREFVTVHTATGDDDETVIGDDNVFLGYTHIAHDCVLGDHIVASNHTTLAGHVTVEDHAVFGGVAGVHQFCRVGTYAMVGAMAKVTQDTPPFMVVDGNPSAVRSFNRIAVERAGFSAEQVERVKFAFRALYREGLNRAQALEKIESHPEASSDEIRCFLQFARLSTRGFVPGHRD